MSLILQSLRNSPHTVQWVKAAAVPAIRSISMRDAPIIDVTAALAKPEEVEAKNKLSNTIAVPTKVDVSPISGVPSEHVKTRRVRIHIPPRNVMQSGTNNIQTWHIDFDTRERWENPLMGWTSTGDPLSNIVVGFSSKEEAINYCERNNWRWFVEAEEQPSKERVKNYGVNFAWNKRTRVSTK